jgi:unsaturated rhamnogalacturonyl hydrolase
MRLLSVLFACSLAAAPALPAAPVFNGQTPLEWSERMARSEMARHGDGLFWAGTPRPRWDYTNGLLSLSLLKMGERIGDEAMRDYGARISTTYVADDGSIHTYRLDEYNIDMITPGKVVLLEWQRTGEERYRQAAQLLRRQLTEQPRTSEGGFWHKQRYPYQMWLDGLYMGAPFYAHYAELFNEPESFNDITDQFHFIDRRTYDPKENLHYHAWDEKREQPWADKETGLSANFWGRASGWFAMAVVDALDFIPRDHPRRGVMLDIARRLAVGIEKHQDADGLWWQVLNYPGREGNYQEATVATMYVYFLTKAVNEGYLPRDRYLPVARRGFDGLTRKLIRIGEQGDVNLIQCVEVSGLGGLNLRRTMPRDGSFEYYISEPIVENDLKGVGPFILAGIELQRAAENEAGRGQAAIGWEMADEILARIQAPSFPDRAFSIADHGAVADGKTLATEAIRKAIEACHAAGGGRVVVPAGEWLTGAIHLKSNVNLHVSEGATLRFSTNPDHYPVVFTRWEGVEMMGFSPLIYAFEQENIAITGKGTLDGQGSRENWWAWKGRERDGWKPGLDTQIGPREKLFQMAEDGVPVEQRIFAQGSGLRPPFIQPYRSRNVLIEGVTVRNSPMWHLNPVLCENVIIRGVTVIGHGPNNDGANPESCRDVLIEDCLFDTGDDCIAIKSGRNADGRRIGVPSENIIIRNCVMKDGHGGVVMGSEISGGCRNVFVENCQMDSPKLQRALRFKNNAMRGGVIENVFMRDVRIGQVSDSILTIDLLYEEGADGPHFPVVRNVQMERVTSENSPRVLRVVAFPASEIDQIVIRDSVFKGVTGADVLRSGGSIQYINVEIEPGRR